MRYERFTLPSGLRVVHVPMPAMHSVTLGVFVGIGSRYETAPDIGGSHLIEHMLFRGTARRPTSRAISDTLDSVGGILNASTDKELTVYWAKVACQHVPLAVDLLADMLRCSRWAPADLSREKRIVLEELSMLADDGAEWVHVLADETLWPQQPLGREVAGTRASVRGLQRTNLIAYSHQYYGSNNAVVSVAGGLEPRSLRPLLEAHFDGWEPVPAPPPLPATIPPGAPRVRLEDKPTEQVNLCLAYPGVARQHPDRWALDLLFTILGGGTSSRLFLQLRERLGLVYDVHSYPTYYSDTGALIIHAAMDPSRRDRAVDAILREVERLQRRRVAETELRKAQQYFRGRLVLGLEDTSAVANWFGAQEMLHHEVQTPEDVAAAIEAVTADDLRRVAQTYLQPHLARLAAIGPSAPGSLEAKLA